MLPVTYIPVPITELPINQTYDFDLYLTYNKKFILFRGKNLPLDDTILQQLRDNGVTQIYVEKGDYPKYLKLLYQSEGYKGDNNFARYLQEKFILIDGLTLKVGSKPPFTVFYLEKDAPAPLIAPDFPGMSPLVMLEHQTDFPSLYIFKTDLSSYHQYLNDCWSGTASFSPLNYEGGLLVRENAKMAAYGLYHSPNLIEAMSQANETVSNVLGKMSDNRESYYTLLKVSEQDFNTYIHSVNLSVLAMGLGMEMKMSDKEIHYLGLGGMLHDIGKRRMDKDLLLKKNKISPAEYEKLQDHVALGVDYCRSHPEIPDAVVRIVAQHHERLDGQGYPQGLEEKDLDPLGQIVAIMEIYDALTNRQPFREAFTPFKALEKLRQSKRAINQTILSDFIRLLGTQRKDP